MSFSGENPTTALAALCALSALKLAGELAVLRHHGAPAWTPLKRTARLLTGRLRQALVVRVTLLVAGGLVLPGCVLAGIVPQTFSFAAIVFALLLAGELVERYLFFTAVSPTQMPGGLPA
jgi:DMSO reductase anchor subunit